VLMRARGTGFVWTRWLCRNPRSVSWWFACPAVSAPLKQTPDDLLYKSNHTPRQNTSFHESFLSGAETVTCCGGFTITTPPKNPWHSLGDPL